MTIGEYNEKVKRYQRITGQVVYQYKICGEYGHNAASCYMYYGDQEVCGICGNFGHYYNTCPWSKESYDVGKPNDEQYNEEAWHYGDVYKPYKEVYQQGKWNDHFSNDLGGNDYSYASPQDISLEDAISIIKEFLDEMKATTMKSMNEENANTLEKMDDRGCWDDEWQQDMDSYNGDSLDKNEAEIIGQEEGEESPISSQVEEEELAESMKLHPNKVELNINDTSSEISDDLFSDAGTI